MGARDVLWHAGAPIRLALLGVIRAYRVVLSGWLGGQCRFYPTCSQYAETAILEHGALRGASMAVWRIARCNPYGRGGIDPVPSPRRLARIEEPDPPYGRAHALAYDTVIRLPTGKARV